jgi:hypothetical protein
MRPHQVILAVSNENLRPKLPDEIPEGMKLSIMKLSKNL